MDPSLFADRGFPYRILQPGEICMRVLELDWKKSIYRLSFFVFLLFFFHVLDLFGFLKNETCVYDFMLFSEKIVALGTL